MHTNKVEVATQHDTHAMEMIILMELMPTSLRRELEREYMPPSQVSSIGLDVARALNYLHQMQPDPIIYRDISSANVFLEPLPMCPGNPTYAAPEASDPHMQSPKMDIFSFGILLIEMLTGELPPSDERHQVMGHTSSSTVSTYSKMLEPTKRESTKCFRTSLMNWSSAKACTGQ